MLFSSARLFSLAGCLALLASCTLGPDYKRPQSHADQLSAFAHADAQANAAVSSDDAASMSAWWRSLDDPLIDAYVEQLLAQNFDLRMAAERVVQAQQGLVAQSGARYPRISADASASRRFIPGASLAAQQGGNVPGGALPDRFYIDDYGMNVNVSWTLDVFGRVRRGIEAADARFLAGVNEYEALQHALIAQLVQRRLGIAIQNDLLSLAQENVVNRQEFSDMIRDRYDLGTASVAAADVYLAQENVASVKGDVHAFERQRSDEILLLESLLGQAPGSIRQDAVGFARVDVPDVAPMVVPFALLDRRPDVGAAALRFKAANAEIGVAIADLYPSFSIGAALGVSAPSSRNLISSENLTGSLLGSIMARLFEGGALRANIRIKESQARELALNYEKVVMDALREVESHLMAEQQLAQELALMRESVAALERAEAATLDRYQRGLSNVRQFLDTQQRRYLMAQQLVRLEGQFWQNRVALFLALGGDWVEGVPQVAAFEVQDEE